MNIFTQLQVDVRRIAKNCGLRISDFGRSAIRNPKSEIRKSSAAPYLESPDGRMQMPLRLLTGAGSVIGRGPSADLTVDSALPHAETVAERHARICQDEATGYVMIEDLDSANGVFINGRRAPRKNLLKDRWTIGLGSLTLVYRDGNSDTGRLE